MNTMTYETHPGQHIDNACKEAVALAIANNCNVEFDFNGQKMTATPSTDANALARHYHDESERRHQEYINSPEYKERMAESERLAKEKKAKLDVALSDAPKAMTLKDVEKWRICQEKNKDGYGVAILIYAERWARLMEGAMAKGSTLKSVAKDLSHLADDEGITGFMYGAAVSILSTVWIHGEELRRWHNLDTQIGNEGEKANESGGTLNPALLNISAQ